MDRQIESKCRELVENYRVLAAGNKMEFSEMILACAGIYLAAGIRPEMSKVQESKKILKSKAGISLTSEDQTNFLFAARWHSLQTLNSILKI